MCLVVRVVDPLSTPKGGITLSGHGQRAQRFAEKEDTSSAENVSSAEKEDTSSAEDVFFAKKNVSSAKDVSSAVREMVWGAG